MQKKRKKIQYIKVPIHQSHNIAGRLQFAMKVRGYTQNELAERIFVNRTTINGYCNGYRTPSCNCIRLIAIELNVSTDYLLGLDDYITL